jgi:hypothetical protein
MVARCDGGGVPVRAAPGWRLTVRGDAADSGVGG